MATFSQLFIGGGGGTASMWEDKLWMMLAESCATQADRNEMSYGAGEPFVDATDITLTNATVASGYCANTVGAGLAYGTQTWSTGGSLPTAGLRATSVISDGTYAYLLGGQDGANYYTSVYRTALASLEAGTQTWEPWGGLPTATGYAMSAISDGTYVYVIGGNTGSANYTTVYRTTLAALRAGTQTWTAHGSLPSASANNLSVVADESYVYVIGGYTGSAVYTAVYRTSWVALQAGTQTWTAWGGLPNPSTSSNGVSVISDGTYVYILGGANATFATVVYRTTWAALQAGTQTWTAWGSLPTSPAFYLAPLLINNVIYVIGGYNGSANYTTVNKTPLMNINAATILLDEISVTSATAGKIIFTGYNADATAVLDVGSTGSNLVEVYPTLNTTPGSALAFTSEDLGSNKWRFTSAEFSLSGATTFGVKFQSFARTVAPNFRLYEALFVWR